LSKIKVKKRGLGVVELDEFLNYFQADLFIPELNATTKEELLTEMVNYLAAHRNLKDTQLILEMLKHREDLGSTGIGYGIAIPHGRTLSVSELLVVFGKTTRGVDFDAIDGQPVHLIFMIVAPPQEQSNVYLPFLGKLVELLKTPGVREQLQEATTFQEFISIFSGEF